MGVDVVFDEERRRSVTRELLGGVFPYGSLGFRVSGDINPA